MPGETRHLSETHRRFLNRHAINPDTLERAGAYTATGRDQLPERILCPTPALCFPLKRVDSTSIVWQARPDTPRIDKTGRPRKYLCQAKETGVLFDPSGVDEWKNTGTLLLTEGTKQTFACQEWKPDDTGVIGILGCQNWTTQGNPCRALYQVIRESHATRIIVLFDADLTRNPNVWKAGKRLADTITHLAETLDRAQSQPFTLLFSTVMASIGNSKADLDGTLGPMTPQERRREIERIIHEAHPLPQWGADLNHPIDIRPDWGLTLRHDDKTPPDPDTMPVDTPPDNTIMNAALTVDTAYQWIPDPHHPERRLPDTILDLRLAIWRPGQPPAVNLIKGETWTSLKDLGSLTLKGSGSAGLGVTVPTTPNMTMLVLGEMRRMAETARLVQKTPRTGWQAHPRTRDMVWAGPQGAIGPDGLDRDFQSSTNDIVGHIDMTQPGSDADALRVTWLTGMLTCGLPLLLADRVRADACLAAYALSFLPIPPRCAIGLFGEYGKGKSTVMQVYSSLLSSAWRPSRGSSEFNFYATENSIGKSMDGIDGMPVFYDDMKKPVNRAERQRLNDTFDAIVRRSHGSQAKMRATVDRERNTVVLADRDDSQPLAFIVGERIPSDAAASALSRIFQVPMGDTYSLRDGDSLNGVMNDPARADEWTLLDWFTRTYMTFGDGYRRFDRRGNNTLLGLYRMTDDAMWRAITPMWIRWLADRANRDHVTGDGRAVDYMMWLEDRRTQWQSRVMRHAAWRDALDRGVALSTREAVLVASLMTGLEQWLTWAGEVTRGVEPVHGLVAAMGRDLDGRLLDELVSTHLHGAVNDTGDDTGERNLLDVVRSAVASGRVRVEGIGVERSHETRPVIGRVVKVAGVECVALVPNAMIAELRLNMTARDVCDGLRDVASRDGDGNVRRPVWFAGVTVRAVCVPRTLWDGRDAEEALGRGDWDA